MTTELGLGPLLESPSLVRLANIRFMGILGTGLSRYEGSRLDHSQGVAYLSALAAETLELPQTIQRHLVAAALLHDVSQWALSHTSEGAFRQITGTSNGMIVEAMLFDRKPMPSKYHLGGLMRRLDIDGSRLWRLLDKKQPAEDSDREWAAAATLIRAAINPDTLDGIPRAAAAYRVPCPSPVRILKHLRRGESGEIGFDVSALRMLDDFWKAKACVYREYIHAPEAIRLERSAALGTYRAFRGWSFANAFDLTDVQVVDAIADQLKAINEDDLTFAEGLRFRAPKVYSTQQAASWTGSFIPLRVLNHRYGSDTAEWHQKPGKRR